VVVVAAHQPLALTEVLRLEATVVLVRHLQFPARLLPTLVVAAEAFTVPQQQSVRVVLAVAVTVETETPVLLA
jgi:hypothetical protein